MSPEVVGRSREVMAAKARTFNLAARLLPAEVRDDAAVVYAFCRLVDDSADEAADSASAERALDRLDAELDGESPRSLIREFLEVARRLNLPLESARELIRGARSDLGPVRMADDAELLRYCYRVASTVGLMMCAVLRVRSEEGHPHAVDLGIAMQLTNIARDVAEDAARNRVYLPRARLQEAGIDPEDLAASRAERAKVARVVDEVLTLADVYYRSADGGMRDIPMRYRPAILVASRVYRAIGVQLRRRSCDALAGRTVVPLPGKLVWGSRAVAASFTPRMMGLAPRTPHDPALHHALSGLPGVHA